MPPKTKSRQLQTNVHVPAVAIEIRASLPHQQSPLPNLCVPNRGHSTSGRLATNTRPTSGHMVATQNRLFSRTHPKLYLSMRPTCIRHFWPPALALQRLGSCSIASTWAGGGIRGLGGYFCQFRH